MNFAILSDMHMEFGSWDFEPLADTFYLCAGDIDSNLFRRKKFLDKHKSHMFYVYGNHDFYSGSMRFHQQDTKTREVDGLKIAGATLWTDLTDEWDWKLYCRGLVDFRCIYDMTHEDYNRIHRQHLNFLMDSRADIIVTHHCPTLKSIAPEYAESGLNMCFSNDLEAAILNMKKPPKVWICGHTHWAHDYWVGNTHVICWPRGYPNENPWYDDYKPKVIEL